MLQELDTDQAHAVYRLASFTCNRSISQTFPYMPQH